MKTKRMTRVLVMVLVLAMVLSVSALAAWPVYGGNSNHSSITSGAPITKSDEIAVSLTPGTSGWDGIDNVPVMQTVNDVTYAYVLFDGRGTNGAQVIKYDCTNEEEVWRTTPYGTQGTSLNAKSGFQLSTPYLDEENGTLYVGVISQYDDYTGGEWLTGTGSKILAITNLDGEQPTVTNMEVGINGQINTPIVKYGNYIYFGTWPGGSNAGKYYQIDVTTQQKKIFAPASYGFYWAGAVKLGNYLYFGSDNAKLYYRSVGDSFNTSGGVVDLTLQASDAGNVRSTVTTDGTYLYFTSQGNYLWCYKPDANGVPVHQWHVTLGGTSTSAPTVVTNDSTTSIYTGYYSGFNAGGVQVTTYPKDGTPTNSNVSAIASGFPVQCSILYSDGYIYFNTNSQTGCGYCYNVSTKTQAWKTADDTYALGGMACDNGIIVFGNDYNNLYVVK